MNPFRLRKFGLRTGLILAAVLFNVGLHVFSQRPDEPLISLTECWRNTSIMPEPVKAAFDKNGIYVAERGGRISALSIQTGSRIWSTELGGEIRSNIAILGSNIYVVAGPTGFGKAPSAGSLRALSASTGVPIFDVPLTGAEARLIPAAGRMIILTSSGLIESFEKGSKALSWQRNVSQINLESAVAWDDKLAFAEGNLTVRVISAATGADLSVVPTQHQVSALGTIDNDLVWGDDRGDIVRYDLATKRVYWRFKNGARVAGLVSAEEGVIAASLDNFTYFISSYYGSVRWKKRLPGRVESVTPFGKGLIVVETVGEPTAALIDLENGKAVSLVSIGDDSFIEPPLDVDGRLILFTNRMILAQSADRCSSN